MNRKDKIILVVIIVVAVCLFMVGRCNGIHSVTKSVGSDTTINKVKLFIGTIPVPYKIEDEDSIVYWAHTIHDTVRPKPIEGKPYPVYIDTTNYPIALVKDYISKKYYSLDTFGVKVEDTVSQNRIIGRGLTITRTDTIITNTIVLTPPRHIVGYFTLSAAGNKQDPLSGAGAGFSLKLPNETIFGIEAKTVMGNRPMAEFRISLPIRFKRK